MITQLWTSQIVLITELQKESENAIEWFRSNKMTVNPYILVYDN